MKAVVYGRNLAHGNVEGSGNCNIYIRPLGGGAGQWAQIGKVNPYRVEFTIPSSVGAGSYEVWVHNGHGGDWGWSRPVKLTVVASSAHVQYRSWGSVVTVAAPSGDPATDLANINKAVSAASNGGNVVQFQAGTYLVSGPVSINQNTKWQGTKDGSGRPATIIKLAGSFNNSGEGILNRSGNLSLNMFEDIKLEAGGFSADLSGGANEPIFLNLGASSMIYWKNCTIDARGMEAYRQNGDLIIYIWRVALLWEVPTNLATLYFLLKAARYLSVALPYR
jgi:hypothetical protein